MPLVLTYSSGHRNTCDWQAGGTFKNVMRKIASKLLKVMITTTYNGHIMITKGSFNKGQIRQ